MSWTMYCNFSCLLFIIGYFGREYNFLSIILAINVLNLLYLRCLIVVYSLFLIKMF